MTEGRLQDSRASLLARAMADSKLAAYRWDIASDRLDWSEGAAEVLGCDPAAVDTGRHFASLLDPLDLTSRHDTVLRGGGADSGEGVSFRIEYRFLPQGRRGREQIWLEDRGSWHADQSGRPATVYGTLRRRERRPVEQPGRPADALTGLPGRARLAEALGGALAAAEREGSSCALLLVSLTNLAAVNEAYGFGVADQVIASVAGRLARVARAGDTVARQSGATFGIILNHCGRDSLAIAAERFLATVRESVIETVKGPVWALLSIGAVLLPQQGRTPDEAMALAGEALAAARREPAGGVVIHEPSERLLAARSRNAQNATEIIRCLKENRFQLAFQPVVDARSAVPVFHEALLRMKAEDGCMVAAGHLIPIAETLGLIRLIDKAVAEMAMDVLARHPAIRISLNLSGTTATDPRWTREILAVFARNRDLCARLIVEITETVALNDMVDMRHTIRFVEELRHLGCSVAIDDFGAGFTSFRSLRALPVEFLKLDGSFCQHLAENDENQYYVRSLIDMAKTFGLRTVAEWVETEEDAALLRHWGVDLMQGRLFGMGEIAPAWMEELPPAAETVAAFEMTLESELQRLRRTISLLDTAFAAKLSDAPPEPSLADLVSDTARRRAR